MTHFLPCLLAAADVLDSLQDPPLPPQTSDRLFSGQLRDVLLVVGAALAMAFILFLWAYLTRKDRQRHLASSRGTRLVERAPRRGHSRHSHNEAQGQGQGQGQGQRRRVRRRKSDHPDNLRRNPTLAEAGGLPPLRPIDPEPPPGANPPQAQTQ